MEELLALSKPPDAVFCYNDLLAIGALRVAITRGLKVPDDIAVVGFDDIEEGRYCVPCLTTVSPDKEDIAQAAIDHLFARIEEPDRPFVSHVSDHQLVARESSLGSEGTLKVEQSPPRGRSLARRSRPIDEAR
jgi:DNA-binding LacI/PurR family transcriptional regulator